MSWCLRGISNETAHHVGVLVLLWTLFFWRFAAPDPGDRWALADGDFTQQFGVFRDIVYRSLVAGRAPLWADCLLSGYPIHADPQTQLFYFPSWIAYAVLRLGGWGHYPIGALTAEALAHYLLISLLLYAFLRSEVRRPAAALFGAAVFTYSGVLTGFPALQTAIVETLTWLPLALLCLRKLAESRRPAYLAGASLALAVAYFGGHPQTFTFVGGVALAYLIFRGRLAGAGWLRLAGWAGGLGLLTAGLCAAQLVPSLQFISLSNRAAIPFDEASGGLAFRDVAGFFLPGLVSYWNYLYVGILPLIVAAFGGLAGRRAHARFWVGVALAGLLLSFGARGGLYDVVYWLLPPIRLFRGQERFSLVVAFALAVLAALGADLWLGPLAVRARRTLRGLERGGAALLVVSLAVLAVALLAARAGDEEGTRLAGRAGLLVLFTLLALAAVRLRLAWPAARRWQAALLLAVAALDLFAVNRGLNASPPFETYAYTPLLDPVRAEAGFFRVQDDFQLTGHAGCGYGFRQVEGITPYRLASYQTFLDRAPEPVRWRLLGVRYLITWRQGVDSAVPVVQMAQAPSAPGVPNDAGITKTFLVLPLPQRAFVVHQAQPAADDEALYGALSAQDFDPFRTAYTREPVGAALGPASAGEVDGVSVISDVPGRVNLAVGARNPGLLVLSEAWYPGWVARVDGAPARAVQVDGALVGAVVPAGSHDVSFEFHAPALAWGGVVSLGALIAAIILSSVKRQVPGATYQVSRVTYQVSRVTDYVLRFTHYATPLALLFGSALRLYRLAAVPLRGDEAFAVTFAAFPLREMFAGMARSEPNPPLYWLLLRGWMSLAGNSELAVRLPSVLAGILAVALTYRLARALLPAGLRQPAASAAAWLAAINPFLIWHAQDARVYSLLAALTLAATWQTWRAVQKATGVRAGALSPGPTGGAGSGASPRGSSTRATPYTAFLLAAALWGLALFAHYFAAFALACVLAGVALSPAGRRAGRPSLVALAALGLAYLPWALYAGPLLLAHTKDWIRPTTLGEGFGRTLAAFTGGTTLNDPQRTAAALVGGVLAVLGTVILLRTRRSISNPQSPIPVLAWGPPFLLALLSLWRPAFDERFVIASLPALLILIAVPVTHGWRGFGLPAILALGLLAGAALRSLGNYYFDPAFAKSPNWPGLAAYLAGSAAPGDVILQDFDDPAFGYYYHGPAPVEVAPPDVSPDQAARLAALLEAHPRLWFFLSDATTAGGDWLNEHAERLADGRVYGFRLQVFDSTAGSLAAMIPFERRFAGGIRLVGYRLFPYPYRLHAGPGSDGLEGGGLHLTLYWQADSAVPQDYTVFTHFVAADGFRLTGHDSQPAAGRRPTSGWQPGELIVDPHDLALPADLAPGDYAIRVGLYDAATGERLSMVDSADDFVVLPMSVHIESP